MVVIGNCVDTPFSARYSGTYSLMLFLDITTPAAWVDACLGIPSRALDISSTFATVGFVSYIFLRSGLSSSALSIVIFRSNGIAFAMASVSP